MSKAANPAEFPQYRSISSWAVLALLFGLASPLAIASPLLLVIPLAAIFLAVVALRQVAANAEILSGRGPALTALFLGAALLVFVPTRLWLRYELVKGRAQELAGAFFDLLQAGQYRQAHELAQLKYVVPGPGSTPDEYAAADKLTPGDLKKFEETPTVRNMAAIDNKFTYRFDAVEPTRVYPSGDYFVLRYQIVPDSSLGKPPFPVWITISRAPDSRTRLMTWKILKVADTFKREEE